MFRCPCGRSESTFPEGFVFCPDTFEKAANLLQEAGWDVEYEIDDRGPYALSVKCRHCKRAIVITRQEGSVKVHINQPRPVSFEALYQLGISAGPYGFDIPVVKPAKNKPFYADFKGQRKARNHLFKEKRGSYRGRR